MNVFYIIATLATAVVVLFVVVCARRDARTAGLPASARAHNARAAQLRAAEQLTSTAAVLRQVTSTCHLAERLPARLDPVCESCEQRAASVLVKIDGQVFRVCVECAPRPLAGAA